MPTIDYSILPFRVFIGDLEITDCLTKFEISRPIPEQGNILTWTGNLETFFNAKSSSISNESQLDPITNPSYFRPYQQVCQLTILNFTVCYFYLEKYVYDYQEQKGEGSIYQILDIASGNTPSEEVELPLNNQGNALGDIIAFCIQQAFEGSSKASPSIVFDKSKHTGRYYNRLTSSDLISEASDFAFKNYYWLYLDTLNRVDHVSGDPEKSSHLIVRSLDKVELKPLFDNLNFASDKVIVTGSREYSDLLFSFGFSFEVLDPPENDKESFDDEGRRLQLITNTFKKTYQVYPELATQTVTDANGNIALEITDTSDILYEQKIVEYKYWGINPPYHPIDTLIATPSIDQKYLPQVTDFADQFRVGDLVQTIITTYRIAGEVFPVNPGTADREINNALVFYDKTVETDWCKVRYMAKGLVDSILLEQTGGISVDTSEVLISSEPIKSGRINPDGTIPEPIKSKSDDEEEFKGSFLKLEEEERPEERQKEPELDLKEEILTGNASFEPVGWIPFRRKPYTVELGFIPDQEHADYLALQLGKREIRRRDAISVTMPIPIEYLQSGCLPLQKAKIHNLELLITEEIISIDDGKMQFAFTGERIGLINPIQPTPDSDPFLPGQILYLLNQNHFLIQSESYLVQLEILGGTPAYTFSSITLPDGLTLSSTGVLSGTPTSNGQSSHLIQITDSLANVLEINLNFSIADNNPSIALDVVKSDLETLLSTTAESIFRFGLTALTVADSVILTASQIIDLFTTNGLIQSVIPLFDSASTNGVVTTVTQISGEGLNNIYKMGNGSVQLAAQISGEGLNNILKAGDGNAFIGYLIQGEGIPNRLRNGDGTLLYNPQISGEGLNNTLKAGDGTVPSFRSETTALLARFVGSYSDDDKNAIDTLVIRPLIDNNLWNKIDAFGFTASPIQADALLNWKTNTYNLTINGATVTFTANQGFSTSGSGHLRTGFVPSTAGGNYSQDSATLGVYSRTNATQTSSPIMGASSTSPATRSARFFLRNTNNNSGATVNNNTQFFSANTLTNAQRLYLITRTASNASNIYKDGTSIASSSSAGVSLPAHEIYILANNNAGTTEAGSAHQIAFWIIAAGLNSSEIGILNTIVTNYLTYKGVNV